MRPRGGRGADGQDRTAEVIRLPVQNHILITGCSGGGKSTLIEALAREGFAIVSEPGRRLIAAGIYPWDDLERFLIEAARLAEQDLQSVADVEGPVFFDRGLIDAFAGLERLGGPSVTQRLGKWRPYARRVFLAPPWPAIFQSDDERRHGFDQARIEYDHLVRLLPTLDYVCEKLPLVSVERRVAFIRERL